MINRRGAIVAMGAAAIGAVPSNSKLVRLLQWAVTQAERGSHAAQTDAADKAIDDRLRQDLASPTAYSEEGVPVFLACEDLVSGKNSPKANAALTAFNATLASELRKTSESWKRIHLNAPEGDVAKVIEVLAHRDFDHGGMETQQ